MRKFKANEMDIRPRAGLSGTHVLMDKSFPGERRIHLHKGKDVNIYLVPRTCPFSLIEECPEDVVRSPNMKMCFTRRHVAMGEDVLTFAVPYLSNSRALSAYERLELPSGTWASLYVSKPAKPATLKKDADGARRVGSESKSAPPREDVGVTKRKPAKAAPMSADTGAPNEGKPQGKRARK